MGESNESLSQSAEAICTRYDGAMAERTYESEALEALSGVDLSEAITEAAVKAWVSLQYTNIQSVKSSKTSEEALESAVPLAKAACALLLTCLRHLTISRGQTAACVIPQAKIPPTMHLP